jgi:hypothetical protein
VTPALTVERTHIMMLHTIRSRAARLIAWAVLLVMASVSAVSAETLMMPKRDARKGVAVVVWGVTTQANGTPFTLSYGDLTPDATGSVTDRSYIAFAHSYAAASEYTATLTVGAESATVKVSVFDPAALPGGATGEQNRGLGINMAIQDGLRWLWTAQFNRAANFPASLTTTWRSSTWSSSESSLIALAFENHGYRLPNDDSMPTGLYEKYVVRRALNYVIQSLTPIAIASQASGFAGQPVRNPCVGTAAFPIEASPCTGLRDTRHDTFHESYTTGVAILALAGSGALNRTNTEITTSCSGCAVAANGYINGKKYGDILQRMVNALAWGQIDGNNIARGGWYYNFNSSSSDGSTVGWDLLAMLDAGAAGAAVPAWVNTEFAFSLVNSLNADGSFDYQSSTGNNSPGVQKVGVGLQGLFFIGELTGARVTAVTNNINSWWTGSGGIGSNSWSCGSFVNKGCAYSMFNNFKGLKLHGITTLPNVNRPAGSVGDPDDWYMDYQDWLVANQTTPNTTAGGQWSTMGFSCCYTSTTATAAIAELILSPVTLVLPDPGKFSTVGLSPATASAVELGSHTVTAKALSTNDTPVPGATVNFTILTGPNAGMTGSDVTDGNGEATFTYTDAGPEGSTGTDTIQAAIGSLLSNIVEMIWTPLNTPPVAVDDAFAFDEDGLLAGSVAGNDSDVDEDDVLTWSIVDGPTNGDLVFNPDGSFSYMPDPNYYGPDSFSYLINDGMEDSGIATVNITVNPVNDAPTIADQGNIGPVEATGPLTPVSYTVNGDDVEDGGPLASICTPASDSGFPVGDTLVSCTVTDSGGLTATDTFVVSVVDTTPPTVTCGTADGLWHATDVGIACTASDIVGLANPADAAFTLVTSVPGGTETANAFTGGRIVCDASGNCTPAGPIGGNMVDKLAPSIAVSCTPAPNGNGWYNTDVTATFLAADGGSGVAGAASTVVVFSAEGAGQGATQTFADNVGNSSSASTALACGPINIDKTPPSAFNQFDPKTRNVLVFGRDGLSGVPSGPIAPVSVVPARWSMGAGADEDGDSDSDSDSDDDSDSPNAELRTYVITDAAGNTLTIVELVQKSGNQIKVRVVSHQYNDGPVVPFGRNLKHFEWSVDRRTGALRSLEQELSIGQGADHQRAHAVWDPRKNQTTITVHGVDDDGDSDSDSDSDGGGGGGGGGGTTKIVKPGLVFLRMVIVNGELVIEY